MLLKIEKIIKGKANNFYVKNKKHIGLAIRVAVVMFFAIAIGVNCLYLEDYILLMIYVIGIGIIVFFVPIDKIKKFLDIEE